MNEVTRNKALETIITDLDISPTDFELARSRYKAVAEYLKDGAYQSGDHVEVYLQGSFRLGTVIRPYLNKSDADYDIDQVCEINGHGTGPRVLKNDVGDHLKDSGVYGSMLDDEGKRCWTILYASQENRPGFHLDVLPARLDETQSSTKIDITNKENAVYSWKSSNPRGYYYWFKSKNIIRETTMTSQRSQIFEKNASLYKSAEEVPKQLIRTNLQRAIQLMKRHRDVSFDGKEFKPISIIITTICAHKYTGSGIYETIVGFCDYVTDRLSAFIRDGRLNPDNILDYSEKGWRILNPSDGTENFADRWEIDKEPERAKAFFSWVFELKRSLKTFDSSSNYRDLCLAFFRGSPPEGQYPLRMIKKFEDAPVSSNDPFLNLIHLAIEGKADWKAVNDVAVKNVDDETDEESKDVAWINFYQVRLHAGYGLSDKHKDHIRGIRHNRSSNASFKFCCSLLLGEATIQMLRDCMWERDDNILHWPIVRLASRQRTDLKYLPIA